jgi:hypothetical protein
MATAYKAEWIRGIVRVALELGRIVRAQPSLPRVTLGSGDAAQVFDLVMDTESVGYCARLVRQCVEVGCEFQPHAWRHAGASALQTCQNLRDAGYKIGVGDQEPGCVVGINRNSGQYGHVGIYVGRVDGVESIVENTSDHVRGRPARAGTKVTPWSAIAARVTGVYRLGPYVAETAPETTDTMPGREWQFTARLEGSDIVAEGWATHFDDKTTRTGVDASKSVGCSLPRGLCEATKGSPFAAFDIPDFAQVRIYCPETKRTAVAPVIDEGPAHKAGAGTGTPGSAMIDLTPATAKELGVPVGRNVRVKVRVLVATEKRGRDSVTYAG